MSKVSMKEQHSAWILAAWLLALYIAAYLVLYALGFFDLATMPWNSQENSVLYRLFLPLEWLRRTITGN
jgi:hypothetical protein